MSFLPFRRCSRAAISGIAAALLIAGAAYEAGAQPTDFTDMDFDSALTQAEVQSRQKNEARNAAMLLKDHKSKFGKKAKGISKKTNAQPTPKPLITLDTFKVNLKKGEATVASQQPAPRVDVGGENAITSTTSWVPGKWDSCRFPKTDLDLRDKGTALREILFRFSGADDFYLSFCKTACDDPKTAGWMTGLALRAGSGTSFAFKKIHGRCHYQMVKKADSNWAKLRGVRSSCTCFAKQ